MPKKLIEIDLAILLILFILSGLGSWYFIKTQTDSIQASYDKKSSELNDRIKDLEIGVSKDSTCDQTTKGLKPGELTELFLNMYMFGSGIGYNGIINTSKYDNYVTTNFKDKVRENLKSMSEGPGADPILFLQDKPDGGFKIESEKIDGSSAKVTVNFNFSGSEAKKVQYSLVFDNELWKMDSNSAL